MKGVKKRMKEQKKALGWLSMLVRLVRIDFAARRLHHHGFITADQASIAGENLDDGNSIYSLPQDQSTGVQMCKAT